MNYLSIGLDNPVCILDICQAHMQLEADYHVGGWLQERPSNLRRMEATSVQLGRMQYRPGARWVKICDEREEDGDSDDDVRDIYLQNVLKWGLPIDADMMACMKARYTPEFLARFPQCAGEEYLQGR